MSNIARRVRKRWAVRVQYLPAANLPDAVFQVEEISDLHEIIEDGPDWNLISKITINYNV